MIAKQKVLPTNSSARLRCFFLSFIWCVAFGMGVILSLTNQETASIVFRAASGRGSSISLGVTLLTPLLISAVAIRISVPVKVLPLAFLKGAAYGYCLASSVVTFGNSGWLAFLLLTFSQSFAVVPLLWFWFIAISQDNEFPRKELLVCFLALLIFGVFDYFYISAVLECLIF